MDRMNVLSPFVPRPYEWEWVSPRAPFSLQLPTYDERLLGYGKYGMWASSGEIDILEAKNDMAEVRR